MAYQSISPKEQISREVKRRYDEAKRLAQKENKPAILDLNGLNLNGVTLDIKDWTNVCFKNTSFAGVRMSNADFKGSYFKDVSFAGAIMPGARFLTCNLTGADFRGATMPGASFDGSDLTNANFFDADIKFAKFRKAKLADANFQRIDFGNSKNSHASFADADLSGACFEYATGSSVNFSGAKIGGTRFSHTSLPNANFSGAQSENEETSFVAAQLPQAYFVRAALHANFDSAALEGVNFWETSLTKCNLTGAQMDGAKISSDHYAKADGLGRFDSISGEVQIIPTAQAVQAPAITKPRTSLGSKVAIGIGAAALAAGIVFAAVELSSEYKFESPFKDEDPNIREKPSRPKAGQGPLPSHPAKVKPAKPAKPVQRRR